MAGAQKSGLEVVVTKNREAPGPFLVVCEHASNHFPAAFGTLGLTPEARAAHIAWDPGALGVARRLARLLDAPLVAAGVSRLVYDLNRPPHSPGAMAARSEDYDIPGNARLSAAERRRRTEAVYLPFHAELRAEIARRLARGRPPVIVTIHSFTPVWFGQPRAVEFGVIHDEDPALALAVLAEAKAQTRLDCRLNEPYSAADEVTHTLRLQATPYGLANVMLEIRNDLIATPGAEEAMAATLAPVLKAALAAINPPVTEEAMA
ncbi:MAG: N-formylglutamate amidohydrolase [Rhodobacteraceae bacterium]|jgi:predicted N-formylglutamate amidohydrolase|uniref:N-formylglutamate amidohydrolase n=1 Tax=Albidovulum sp. TaxID=1872424 RepID=UPI001DE82C11|nr:N-formylglutamate amidohydrolase [uncultured Defluviimonas sp.]MCB2127212.1 N-formylglutamate amidohydrolase [Paracoccaceae bacterium]MCC0069254.1 N-formylglutamate amidohydrolase [Paracoccaceae bacterium]